MPPLPAWKIDNSWSQMPSPRLNSVQKLNFNFPPQSVFPEVDIFDPAVQKVSLEQMTKLGEELISRVTQYSPEVICEGGVTKRHVHLKHHQFTGGQGGFRQTVFGLGD